MVDTGVIYTKAGERGLVELVLRYITESNPNNAHGI